MEAYSFGARLSAPLDPTQCDEALVLSNDAPAFVGRRSDYIAPPTARTSALKERQRFSLGLSSPQAHIDTMTEHM
ncbi:hypothetical protein [Bradyrhizobium sp.]|uniref:hypothetical protein n=1 Tax=Bradyrhizobium sp. TaxID=376 RepID=UPI003C77D1DB